MAFVCRSDMYLASEQREESSAFSFESEQNSCRSLMKSRLGGELRERWFLNRVMSFSCGGSESGYSLACSTFWIISICPFSSNPKFFISFEICDGSFSECRKTES